MEDMIIKRARGSRYYDNDGGKWLSFSLNLPLLGYRNPQVTRAVKNTLSLGNWSEKEPYLSRIKDWFLKRISGYDLIFYPNPDSAARLLFGSWLRVNSNSSYLDRLKIPIYRAEDANTYFEEALSDKKNSIEEHKEYITNRAGLFEHLVVNESFTFMRTDSLFLSLGLGLEPDLIWLDMMPTTGFPLQIVFKKTSKGFNLKETNKDYFNPVLSGIFRSLLLISRLEKRRKIKDLLLEKTLRLSLDIDILGYVFRFKSISKNLNGFRIGEGYYLDYKDSDSDWMALGEGHDLGSIDRLIEAVKKNA